jgi:hypothetical protein
LLKLPLHSLKELLIAFSKERLLIKIAYTSSYFPYFVCCMEREYDTPHVTNYSFPVTHYCLYLINITTLKIIDWIQIHSNSGLCIYLPSISYIYSQRKMRVSVEEINGDYRLVQEPTNVKHLSVKITY